MKLLVIQYNHQPLTIPGMVAACQFSPASESLAQSISETAWYGL